MREFFNNFVQLGHHVHDSEEEKLRKSSLMVMSGPFALAGLLWGVLYFANDLWIPGMIPFNYGILSLVSIFYFIRTKRYTFFRNSQLVLILLLPFSLQISLGGFVPGSAVIFWATITPAGALVFQGKKYAMYWYLAFIFLVVIAYFLNSHLPAYINYNLGPEFIDALFLMNIIGVSALVFLIQYYFVLKQQELKDAIEEQNEALELQSQQLKELDEIKSRFFANISHEFRTPLTLILGLIERQIAHPEQQAELKDSLTIKRNSQRLLQLINQLLDLSKLESGELQVQARRGDLALFTRNLLAQFESLAESKNISLTFNEVPIQTPSEVTALLCSFDFEKLQKVLTNLFSNALKFTPEGGRVWIQVLEESESSKMDIPCAQIHVSNTGKGIPPEKLPYVFDRFFQVDAASNRAYEGTGIGLALVKEMVELHGGRVEVKSSLEETRFSVYLPIVTEGSEAMELSNRLEEPEELALVESDLVGKDEKGENEGIVSPAREGVLEILIVEDNADLRSFIKEILAVHYKVSEAKDGKEGLEKALERIPDLIISDVMMPGMDGYELCKQLKKSEYTNHIPVILLTAKAAREHKLEGLQLGADDYLIKPFDKEELLIRIHNLIRIRERLQEKYQQEVWLKPKEVKVNSVHQKFLEKTKEIIEKHLDNDAFGVEDLAKEVGMSRSQLHRKLKALTDQSASNFVRNYRLHRAADLIRQDAGNITEIAYQVGFSSQSYFSSSFQALFSCSPSDFKVKNS